MKSLLNTKNVIFIALLFLSFYSCSNKKKNPSYSHGEIEYSIDADNSNLIYSIFLPKSIVLRYSPDGFTLESSVLMGLIEAKLLCAYSSNDVNILMEMYGDRKYVEMDKNRKTPWFDSMKINKVKCVEKVLDYECKYVELKSVADSFSLGIYYSDYFNDQVSKVVFPGVDIDGMVLKLEFKTKYGNVVIEAKELSDKQISKDSFIIPSTYVKGDIKDIENFFKAKTK